MANSIIPTAPFNGNTNLDYKLISMSSRNSNIGSYDQNNELDGGVTMRDTSIGSGCIVNFTVYKDGFFIFSHQGSSGSHDIFLDHIPSSSDDNPTTITNMLAGMIRGSSTTSTYILQSIFNGVSYDLYAPFSFSGPEKIGTCNYFWIDLMFGSYYQTCAFIKYPL